MDQRLYITHLSGKATEPELNSWLEGKLGETCSTSMKKGKIPGTHIAFVSIGNFDSERAIALLNNSVFMGTNIRVNRYIQTERNKSIVQRIFPPPRNYERFSNEPGATASSYSRENANIGATHNATPPSDQASSQDKAKPTPTSYSGAMVFVTSASEFYIQETSDLHNLMTINSYMDLLDTNTMVGVSEIEFTVGTVLAARYALDNKFYRALILSKGDQDEAEVQFVDFGNKEKVKKEFFVALPDEIAKLDFVAKRCKFYDLKILNEEKAANFLSEAGEKFTITLYQEHLASDDFRSWEVDLLREENKESVKEALIALGFAKLEVSTPSKSNLPPQNDQSSSSPELLSSATCIISHVESCDCFFLQGAYGQSHLAEIYQCLLTAPSLPEIKISDASPSKIYAAVFSKDGTWYRCRLRESDPSKGCGDSPTVYFIDFGNSESFSGSMRVLPEPIAAIPPQAVLCQLAPDLRICNPVKVKNELVALGNNEVPLKCHLQQTQGCEAVNVDFGVEGKYPSFCSWVIENRWAERIYKRKPKTTPPGTNNSSPRFVPAQVTRRQTMEQPNALLQTPTTPLAKACGTGRTRIGPRPKIGGPGPHPTLRNNNNTSPRSTGTTDSGNDSGDRHTELLRSELIDAIKCRQTLENWRNALCHGEKSLMQRLSMLRNLKKGDVIDFDEDIAAYQQLVTLKNAATNAKGSLCENMEKVKTALKDSSEDDILVAATKRDDAAKEFIERVEKFLLEVSNCSELLKKHIENAETLVKKINFLLKQSVIRKMEANGHAADIEEHCEKIWSEYESSSFFEQKLTETELCSKQMEEIREHLGQITGVVSIEGQNSEAIVSTFQEKLKALINAMIQEVNAYSVHFFSGSNGELMTLFLEKHLSLAQEFQEDVKQLEHDCGVFREWENDAKRVVQGQNILIDGTIESLEEMAIQRKKMKSKLRHLLADLEDEEEALGSGSENLASLRQSIAEIRSELHIILERESEIKKYISDSLELRPELAILLKKRLKVDTSLMDDTSIISSWETSFFDLTPIECEGNCYFSSEYKNNEVFVQKILLTSDNRSLLEANLRRYQQVATFSSSLAPLLAAFVPPRDSHVLYLVYPGLELVREIVSSEMLMRVSFALLSAHYDLRSQKISFSMIRPLQFLARMTTDCEPHFVLLPNFTALEGDTDSDLGNLIETLRKEALSKTTPAPALEKILECIISLEDIPGALSRITDLLQMLTSPIKVCDRVEVMDSSSQPELVGDVDDVDMDLNGDDDVGIDKNVYFFKAESEETNHKVSLTSVVVVEKASVDNSD